MKISLVSGLGIVPLAVGELDTLSCSVLAHATSATNTCAMTTNAAQTRQSIDGSGIVFLTHEVFLAPP